MYLPSGYQVPKDTFVFRMGTLMSNSEQYFDNPDKFLPERWFRGIYFMGISLYKCTGRHN